MQAIVTKYLGATNTRQSRIKASAWAGSKTQAYDHSLSAEDNHASAARALAAELHWSGQWFAGGMPNGTGDSFVFVCATNVQPAFTLHADGEA